MEKIFKGKLGTISLNQRADGDWIFLNVYGVEKKIMKGCIKEVKIEEANYKRGSRSGLGYTNVLIEYFDKYPRKFVFDHNVSIPNTYLKKIDLKGDDIYVYESYDGVWAKVFENERRITAKKGLISASYSIDGNKIEIDIIVPHWWRKNENENLMFHFRTSKLPQKQSQIRAKMRSAEQNGEWEIVDSLKKLIEPTDHELKDVERFLKKIKNPRQLGTGSNLTAS